MNNIKTLFSIKDLENLSGIKAHTIRIWEKRYNLLSPNRTDTNIRFYNLKNLQKLLNVTLLYNSGIKISKISILSDDQIKAECRSIISEQAVKNIFINDLKLAMLNFDQILFETSYQKLLEVIEFKDVYISYFMPFLHEIGLLWHTDTINPAHEHFITSLIKQKILVNIEKVQGVPPTKHDNRFILFLPENEIHELGLTFINYEILKRGYSTIYLGQSIPIDCLKSFLSYTDKITFITYLTVEPSTDKIPDYLSEIQSKIISNCNSELWVLGRKIEELDSIDLPNTIKLLKVSELIEALSSPQLIH
jgi:DNA-binding transcriptional MerR regulator